MGRNVISTVDSVDCSTVGMLSTNIVIILTWNVAQPQEVLQHNPPTMLYLAPIPLNHVGTSLALNDQNQIIVRA